MTKRINRNVSLNESYFTPVSDDNIDEEAGIIRGVKVIGNESKNNRKYSEAARKKALPLYEGATVNLDHPDRKTPNAERKFMEGVGVLRDVEYRDDGNYADLHYFKSHPSAALLVERARKDKKNFGLSHNARGTCLRTKQGEICESIDEVNSVDVVTRPATTEGLFESESPDNAKERVMRKISLKQLVESFGSADEKGRVSLLEDAAILDREVELEEGEESVKSGFGAALSELHESEDTDGISKLLAAQKVLKEGVEKPVEEPANPDLKVLQEQVEKLTQERDRMKLEREIETLCESESFKAEEIHVETLMLLESTEKRIKLIESWKQAGRPDRSGRKQRLENLPSYEEARAKLPTLK